MSLHKKTDLGKVSLSSLKVESFVLNETDAITGGYGGGGGPGQPETNDTCNFETANCGCPTFDTTGSCCIQNDNS